ncbi:MAG: hypothetical protein HOV97_44515 [Nonomuraea sp.]|nr:hypothetical protein [Nonomuraea sp.]
MGRRGAGPSTPTRFEQTPPGGERMYEWFLESGYQADVARHPGRSTFESFLRDRLAR